MKTVLALLFGLLTINSYALILNNFGASYDNTGAVKNYDKVFVNVKNGETSTVNSGTLMSWDGTADDGISVKKVVASASGSNVACMLAENLTAGSTGKCQVYGYTSILLFDSTNGSAAALGHIYPGSSTAGYAQYYLPQNSAGVQKLGAFLDASSASGSVEAFLNFL